MVNVQLNSTAIDKHAILLHLRRVLTIVNHIANL